MSGWKKTAGRPGAPPSPAPAAPATHTPARRETGVAYMARFGVQNRAAAPPPPVDKRPVPPPPPKKDEPVPDLPQFDVLPAVFSRGSTLDQAILEHSLLAGRLFDEHTVLLKRRFQYANPVRESYYYCTAIDERGNACTFASADERETQDHIRRQHPGTGAVPRRFGLSRFTGGVANIGPSCSVSAAAAALSTLGGDAATDAEMLKAFRTSQAQDSRDFIRSLALGLPAAPGEVFETLADRNAELNEAFAMTILSENVCLQCGVTGDPDSTNVPGVITYEPPPQPRRTVAIAPAALARETAQLMSDHFAPTAHDAEQICEHCQGQEARITETVHYLFGKYAAITVLPPDGANAPTGLPAIPLEIDLPTRAFATSKYLLHAAVCTTSPSHVVAYVVERKGEEITWHRYNGTLHDASVAAPAAKTLDTLFFVRAPAPPASEAENDQENEEEDNSQRAMVRAVPPAPPPPQRPRDAKGRPLFGFERPEDDEDEESGNEETGDEQRIGPHPPAAAAEPGEARAAEDSDDDAEGPPAQAGTFAHGKNIHVLPTEGLSCPMCARTWTSTSRRAQQTSHVNTTHAAEAVPQTALEETALDRCLSCGEYVVASDRARQAHIAKCGRFVPRAAQNNAKRARQEQRPQADDEGEVMDDLVPPAGPPPRAGKPTEADHEWVEKLPPTIRTLRKQEWKMWADTVGQALLGYTAASRAGRFVRQIALTNLVRENLPKANAGEEGDREDRNEEAEQRAPRNTDEELPGRKTHTPEERRHRRILQQISLGALGKAARTLFHPQAPRARAADIVEQLRGLHPQENPAGYPRPPQIVFPYDLKAEKVKKVVVQRLGRASAPGLDGWTRELLVPVVENAALLNELTALVQDILAARVSPSFAFRLRACVVHPFLKEPGSAKVRPITPESVLLKIASHVALGEIEGAYRATFKGWQFGVWGDAAAAVRQIRSAFSDEEADTLVALDATNAYNAMSRAHVLSACFSHPELRPAFGVVDVALCEPGALGLYEKGRRTEELASTKGVRQGMVLGPLLFANAMAEVIRPVMAKHPGAKVTAYLDDLTVVGARAAVQAFLDEAGPLLQEIGFCLNPAKSHHLSKRVGPEPVSVAGVAVPVATGVVRILGAGFLASGAAVHEWLWEKVGQYAAYFDALEDESLPRLARLTLLRVSALPRLTFLLRTHSPEECRQGAVWFDARCLRVLSVLLGGAVLDEPAVLIARLPLSMGGLGLRSQEAIAKFASACVGRKAAQGEQTRDVDVEVRRALLPLLSEPCLAILKANAAPGATRALADPAVQMSGFALETLARQRLMLRVLRPGVCCACGADADNVHVNVCPLVRNGPRIARHNRVVHAIDAWARQLGISTAVEPRAGGDNRERLDLTLATAGGTFATDVVVTYPGRARGDGQSPLQQAHGGKKRKWANWAVESGACFAPFSMESTGGLHKESLQWMLDVAGSAPFPFSARTALSELLSVVCGAVHAGNAFLFAAVKHQWARSVLRRVV